MPAFSLAAFLVASLDLMNRYPLLQVAVYATAALLLFRLTAALRWRRFVIRTQLAVQAEAKRAAEDRAKARALKVIAANFHRNDRGAA